MPIYAANRLKDRVPRSHHRVIRCWSSAHFERVRVLLLAHANAPQAEQGCTLSASRRAADGWPCDRHSTGRWSAPPLRARRLVSPRPCPTSPMACGAHVRSFSDSRVTIEAASRFQTRASAAGSIADRVAKGFTVPMELLVGSGGLTSWRRASATSPGPPDFPRPLR